MIEIEDLTFVYPDGRFHLRLPRLRVAPDEKVAMIGPSGCGKTTLLSLIAGILLPHGGVLRVAGRDLARESDAARRRFRLADIGLVFQDFQLLEYLTVRDNVLLPCRMHPALLLDQKVHDFAETLAASLGIAEHLDRYPTRLSQGERQRVAIARALVTRPRLLLADEPTGNLDPQTSRTIVEIMLERARVLEASLVAVTHDPTLLERFDRVIDLGSCRIAEGEP